ATGGGGAGAGAGFAGGGAGLVGGFIGLLQQLQQIRNTEESLGQQVRTLALLEAYLDAGFIDLTQVDQFRQSIETERANLLQSRISLQNGIESYLTGTLSLPPNVPVQLDDTLIKQFQFVDPRLSAIQDRILDLQRRIGELPAPPTRESLRNVIARAKAEMRAIKALEPGVKKDIERVDEVAPIRKERMSETEKSIFDRDMQFEKDKFAELVKRLEEDGSELDQIRDGLEEADPTDTRDQLVDWVATMLRTTQEVSLVQARARLETIMVEPIDLRPEEAFQIALENRLDIMNSRAALVDSWRLIQFNADRLQAGLNVVFSGDMSTTGNNAAKFQGPTGQLRASLQFDAPFTRLIERNNYRQALIDFQRSRRGFIQSLDSINRGLRALLRQMEQLRVNLEIQRRAVAISIRRVDVTAEDLQRPPQAAAPGQSPQFGPTAAVNSLTALSDMRNTLNNFMSVWLNYHANRMRLARELGIMQLDDQGRWLDTGLDIVNGGPEEVDAPAPLPLELLEDATGS
ncbi:MAG TPA: hypothetical protein ENJ16_04960, partial [Planctomycetaceae bacterium]|nr:hypothetical protein [Planctomycetaceae bacterium]